MSFGGGFIPSCSIAAKRSGTPQCSINLPSLKRMISMTVISIFFPVGGIGPNCPFWIPRAVIRPHTLSSKTTRSSITIEKSAKALCKLWIAFFTASTFGGLNPYWCSTKSCDEYLSNKVTSPLPNPSSMRIRKSCSFEYCVSMVLMGFFLQF